MSHVRSALLVLLPAAAYVLLSGYGVHRGYPTALYALTVAMVEQRTLCLDGQQELLGYDRAIFEGRLYSDKAPGPSFVMIPAYVVARALTADADLRFTLTVLLGMTLPAATAPLAMALLLRRAGAAEAELGGYAFAFGTLFFPYATVAISDPLATAALAWSLALALSRTSAGLAASGALAGLAILCRYQALLLLLPPALALLASAGRKARGHAIAFAAPLLLALSLVLAYNQAAFGDPLSFPTQHWRGKTGQVPTLQMGAPSLGRLAGMTLSPRRGLFVFTPVLLLAPAGALLLLRSAWRTGALVLASLLLYFGYLLANVGWSGGADYGLRYGVLPLPLLWLLVFTGEGRSSSRLRRVLLVPGVLIALLGALGGPYVPHDEKEPIPWKARQLARDGPRTIFSGEPKTP